MYPENAESLTWSRVKSRKNNNLMSPGSTRQYESVKRPFQTLLLPMCGQEVTKTLDLTSSSDVDTISRLFQVDEQIKKTTSELTILRAKLEHLESAINIPDVPVKRPAQPNVAVSIYQENRLKAASNASVSMVPLYNQPSDVLELSKIREQGVKFQPMLVKYLQRKALRKTNNEERMAKRYEDIKKIWLKEIQKHESQPDLYRESFQKVFEELEPKIQIKKRYSPLSKSENLISKHKERSAIVQPFLSSLPTSRFANKNGFITDMLRENDSTKCYWLPWEHEQFKQALTKHGKKFTIINSMFPKKRCVEHYYLTKKKEKYKELMPAKEKSKVTATSKKSKTKKKGLSAKSICEDLALNTNGPSSFTEPSTSNSNKSSQTKEDTPSIVFQPELTCNEVIEEDPSKDQIPGTICASSPSCEPSTSQEANNIPNCIEQPKEYTPSIVLPSNSNTNETSEDVPKEDNFLLHCLYEPISPGSSMIGNCCSSPEMISDDAMEDYCFSYAELDDDSHDWKRPRL